MTRQNRDRTAPAEPIDLVKLHKTDYSKAKKPRILTPTPGRYLAIDGTGGPGSDSFQHAIEALYGIVYTIKMGQKSPDRPDFRVSKLEALYWGKTKTGDFSRLPKEQWNWKMLIRVPEFVVDANLDAAVATLTAKSKGGPSLADVSVETLDEGSCVQQLHVGPYDTVGTTIESMRAHAASGGHAFAGTYHEIYFSDPRRVAPERLQTLVRIPIAS